MQHEQKQEAYRVEAQLTGMLDKCFPQCVKADFQSAKELTSDEALCVDLCSWKYFSTHKAIGSALARSQVSPTGEPEPKPVRR